MKLLKLWIGILTGGTLFFLSGCGLSPQTKGADDVLTVFCSLEDRPRAELILNQLFNDTLFTPEPEPYYKIHFIEPEDFWRFKMFANLVIVSVGDDPTNPATALAKHLLAPEVYRAALTGPEHLFLTLEPYARNQVLLVISGITAEDIVKSIPRRQKEIKQIMEAQFLQRQSESLFPRRSQKKLEQKLFQKYPMECEDTSRFRSGSGRSKAETLLVGPGRPLSLVGVPLGTGGCGGRFPSGRGICASISPEIINQHSLQ